GDGAGVARAVARRVVAVALGDVDDAGRRVRALRGTFDGRWRGRGGASVAPARREEWTMNRQRVFAIVERELRKFVRTPMILFMTLLMPLMQLFVLGNAYGGRTPHLQVAVVDEDGGPAARRVREALYALEGNGDMIRQVSYDTESEAAEAVRHGKVSGALVIPAQFSRRVYAGDSPHVGLLLDNTDNILSATVRG